LVGVGVRDIEIVGSRARGGGRGTQRLLGVLLAAGDAIEVVAHADDLHRAGQWRFKIRHYRGRKLHGPLLARHVRRGGVADKPVVPAINQHIKSTGDDDSIGALGRIGGKHVLLDDRHIGPDEDPAVESGDRRLQIERPDEHPHATWRPATGDRKGNACGVERLHRLGRARGQHLVGGDPGAGHLGPGERGPWTLSARDHPSAPARALSIRTASLRPRMKCSMALAKPFSRLLVVTKSAAPCTLAPALPIAMLRPACSNMAMSLPPSPITATSLGCTDSRSAIASSAPPLLASGCVISRYCGCERATDACPASAARTSSSHWARRSKSALTPTIFPVRLRNGVKSATTVGGNATVRCSNAI